MSYPNEYNEGIKAQRDGLTIEQCPYGIRRIEKRCWWIAGFNDGKGVIK